MVQFGSVREACQKTGISYSKGWAIIRSAERELGYKIVDCQPGGKNGGQASVSIKGKRLLALFGNYEEKVKAVADDLYKDIFLNGDLL